MQNHGYKRLQIFKWMAPGFKNRHSNEFKTVGVVLYETLIDWATTVPSVAKMIGPKDADNGNEHGSSLRAISKNFAS
jgi:hypothetical protein